MLAPDERREHGPVPIRARTDDGVAWLTLDRPPLNVLDTALLRELDATLASLGEAPDLRLVALRGEGRAFSAGVDVGEHLGSTLGPLLHAFEDVALRLLDLEIPTLAIARGAALGGGCELLALCDLALVADDAKLGVPEITLGVVPPVAAALFPRLIGAQRAAGLVLTGAVISGREAAAQGLVWRSVPAAALDAEAAAVAESFRAKSASALRLAKRTLRDVRPGLRDAIRAADARSAAEVPDLADAQEGLTAFLEKRPARWTHR